ncbi:hypothetical protein CAP36_14765 [Chitinophagaceae bacterium IBVUCB2]|nr:hypothetical protein CAP36_14765 [Chitinophagaceae bacterium IBVUCB2]
MKLAPLLAQYLYIHKRLDLPGLGTFLLDSSTIIDQENTNQAKSPIIEGVTFETNASVKESPELIQFISIQAGKIKALAAADLESHLGLAQQFINIGKPFLFEGIGSLSKIKSSDFIFTPGQVLAEKFVEHQTKETNSNTVEAPDDYKSVFYGPKVKMKWAKPVTLILVLVGIGLAIWGGYTVYKRTSSADDSITDANEAPANTENQTIMLPDTVAIVKKDTLITTVSNIPAGTVKFVLETADAARAFPRLNRLKNFQWNVQMETADSLSYKIFMLLPVNIADTSRVLDSLTRLNGKRVYIEN